MILWWDVLAIPVTPLEETRRLSEKKESTKTELDKYIINKFCYVFFKTYS